MRRPYPTYLLLVVLPSAVAVGVGVAESRRAWRGLQELSARRVGAMALQALQQDLGRTVDSLAALAAPLDPAERADPALARVLEGDTVSGLARVGESARVTVLVPGGPDDPDGTVRGARGPLPPTVAQVGRASGFGTALYLNGRHAGGTTPPPGPDSLPETTLRALGRAGAALPLPASDGGGILMALGDRPGPSPAVAVLLRPASTRGVGLPVPLLLVMGLLLVFAALAGWIQLAGTEAAPGPRRASVLLIALVPALTAWGFFVQADRLFDGAGRESSTRDLTRALAVARARGVAASPAEVRALTGFHATLVRGGGVEATTFGGPAEALGRLPAPPPSFTTSGRVPTPEGPAAYVALRLGAGSFVVATTPEPREQALAFRRRLVLVAGALGAWLLLVAGVVAVVNPRRGLSA